MVYAGTQACKCRFKSDHEAFDARLEDLNFILPVVEASEAVEQRKGRLRGILGIRIRHRGPDEWQTGAGRLGGAGRRGAWETSAVREDGKRDGAWMIMIPLNQLLILSLASIYRAIAMCPDCVRPRG